MFIIEHTSKFYKNKKKLYQPSHPSHYSYSSLDGLQIFTKDENMYKIICKRESMHEVRRRRRQKYGEPNILLMVKMVEIRFQKQTVQKLKNE